ncbi:ribosome biogenesis GTPase YlqF [Saccharophagus degradans]|uniref:Ribosome biogenesis GTPase A n=1 Tax=Saccharophagus degradans (strain 2-40 / ATCC 43961 / DSM 17024) TaxID=203122 RepID=Q21KG3_SACD2|nr:ribosome biogenesis GTPase YlqF [Saccharophagus degradans]ABD80816.1 GTP-binding [Saccharophagus degradans 2-40]
MLINWYPGHMNKARNKVKEIMPAVDVVIEVLDARLPASSTNPMIETLRGDKPYLKVLSKSDLADPTITKAWQAFFREQRNMDSLAITTDKVSIAKTIPDRIRKLLPNRGTSLKPIRALIMGIPNVGKSTLINTLAGKKIAPVGNEPAVTKAQQKIRISDNFFLIDTPGMTWPGSKNEMINYRLAASGAIRDTALEYDDLAVFAMDYMLQRYPEAIRKRYQFDELCESATAMLEELAMKRGCKKNGLPDLTRIGELFVRELRAGKLGRFSLEEPLVSYRKRE